MGSHSSPKEPVESVRMRERQLSSLADLDEEENRRIKALFRARHGGRVFRSPTAAYAPGNSAAGAPSLIPANGFGGGSGAAPASGSRSSGAGASSRSGASRMNVVRR